MPIRVIGRVLRGDGAALQHGWRQVCSEGGRRGKIARAIRSLLRPIVIPAREPSLFIKGWRSLQLWGIRETLHRVRHVFGGQSLMSCPRLFHWEEKDTAELVILTTAHCGYLAELMCQSLKKVNIRGGSSISNARRGLSGRQACILLFAHKCSLFYLGSIFLIN